MALGPERTIVVTKELGGGRNQVLEIGLPALLCTQTGTRRLSHVPFAKLVQARRRPIECVAVREPGPGQQGPAGKQGPSIVDVFTPRRTHAIEMLAGAPGEVARRVAEIIEGAR